MSSDLTLYSAAGVDPGADEIPPNFDPPALGSMETVVQAIEEAFPGTRWLEPRYGGVEGDGYSLEFTLAGEDTVLSVDINAHELGGGDWLTPVVALCERQRWLLLDLEGSVLVNRGEAF